VSADFEEIRRAVRRTIFVGLNVWYALSGRIDLYRHFPSEGVCPWLRWFRALSAGSSLVVNAGLHSFQKERSLRFCFGEFKRFAELFGSSCMIVHPHLELTDHGIE